MKTYELLLFDFDGTLVDTAGDIAHHANAVLAERGLPVCSVKLVQDSIGLGVHELFKGIAPSFEKDEGALEEAVVSFKKRYRQEPVISTAPFLHVRETLEGPLKNAVKAIITNKPQDITLEILDALDLAKYFKSVIGMHAGYPAKPDPVTTELMMKKFSATSEQTVYIGDSNVDAETSRNARVDFAWMDYGYDQVKAGDYQYHFSSAAQWKTLTHK